MALFRLPCKFPNCSLNQSQKRFSIERPFSAKSLIATISTRNYSKNSIVIPPISFSFRTQCCSSSSPVPSVENETNNKIPPASIIFAKGLAKSTSEGSLKTAFSQFGDVSRVKVVTDKKTGQSLGFAYIWFCDEESAHRAVDEMNGKFFEGRFIYVTIARPGSCKTNVKAIHYKF